MSCSLDSAVSIAESCRFFVSAPRRFERRFRPDSRHRAENECECQRRYPERRSLRPPGRGQSLQLDRRRRASPLQAAQVARVATQFASAVKCDLRRSSSLNIDSTDLVAPLNSTKLVPVLIELWLPDAQPHASMHLRGSDVCEDAAARHRQFVSGSAASCGFDRKRRRMTWVP